MANIFLLNPEIFLAAAGLVILLAGAFVGGSRSVPNGTGQDNSSLMSLSRDKSRARLLYHFGIFSAAAALVMITAQAALFSYGTGTLWILDPGAQLFKLIILAATVFTLLMSVNYTAVQPRHIGTYTALLLWASCGMMLLSGAMDLIYLLISLELISISCFILTGFEQKNPKSAEGAIKYFLMGGLSTAVTIYGISLFYGATGTVCLFDQASFPAAHFSDPAYVMGMLCILVGFGFKISMAPFHFWAPDAYEGAPTPVTAYLSVASKLAALGALMRVFAVVIPHYSLNLAFILALLAALTMTLGNLAALFQTNIKRMLAYSSIAQAGYMLIGLVVADPLGRESVFFYALAYLVTNMGIFAVAMIVAGKSGNYELDAYDGLAGRSLGLAIVTVMFLLSLAGIPPLAGFVAKFYVFGAAVNSREFLWLAVLGVVNSAVSVYYYMNIARRMFFAEAKDAAPPETDVYTGWVIVFTSAAALLIGVLPETFMRLVKACVSFNI